MKRRPFDDEAARSGWQLTFDKCQRFYIDDRLIARVNRVEMWRWMIAKIHLDDDAIEATQFRHVWADGLARGKLLRGVCWSTAYKARRGRGRYHQAILGAHF